MWTTCYRFKYRRHRCVWLTVICETKRKKMEWNEKLSIFCENMKIFIISWNTDFHSAKYRFSFHKIQISQRTNFHFVLFNFILQITVSHVCEYKYLGMYIGWVCQWFLSLLWEFFSSMPWFPCFSIANISDIITMVL